MTHLDTVKTLWQQFSLGDYDSTKTLFSDDIKIVWPTSREHYQQLDTFLEVNELFGKDWTFEVLHLEETTSDKVISIIYTSSPSFKDSFYATSVFTFSSGLIQHMETFWAFQDRQPDWRKGISEVY
ncbi:nuclear transport factor 2 family protein [Vibrio mexicanus]|uniref:nuclear transport factor 2 family protein n=1 Tax=Vibrio mexicanus TaxID=1004326 RepID=UPI00063C7DFF|nr:nuclear transport factor 2 family protein [Vibrio mexicanus]